MQHTNHWCHSLTVTFNLLSHLEKVSQSVRLTPLGMYSKYVDGKLQSKCTECLFLHRSKICTLEWTVTVRGHGCTQSEYDLFVLHDAVSSMW